MSKGTDRHLHFAGYSLENSDKGLIVDRKHVDMCVEGDYGCDPLGDGTFKMVPSGDIVGAHEKERRLRGITIDPSHVPRRRTGHRTSCRVRLHRQLAGEENV